MSYLFYCQVGVPIYATVSAATGTTITFKFWRKRFFLIFSSCNQNLGHLTMSTPGTRNGSDACLLNLYGATNNTSSLGGGPHIMFCTIMIPLHTPNRLCFPLVVMNDDYVTGNVQSAASAGICDATNGAQSGSGYMYTFNAGAGTSFFTWAKTGAVSGCIWCFKQPDRKLVWFFTRYWCYYKRSAWLELLIPINAGH